MNKKSKLLVILGPTASGKSDLALSLAKKFNGYLIAADSRQIYKHMDIATGKDSGHWQDNTYYVEQVPEFMVDFLEPDQEYSVAEYKKQVLKILNEQKDQLPIMVGGTGLYISSIVDNLYFPKTTELKKVRREIEKQYETKGLEYVQKKLIKCDPLAKNEVDLQNPRRVIRALEVCIVTGQPFTTQGQKGAPLFDVLQIGISIDREKLVERINQRVEKMFALGIIKEGEELIKKGYELDLPSMTGIGYPEIKQYLDKKITLDQCQELIKISTRQYAKRQMTWLKKDLRIKWVKSQEQASKLVKKWLSH